MTMKGQHGGHAQIGLRQIPCDHDAGAVTPRWWTGALTQWAFSVAAAGLTYWPGIHNSGHPKPIELCWPCTMMHITDILRL